MAIDRLAEAVDGHTQIQGKIRKAQTERGLMDGVYQEAFRLLAECEAAVVMDGGSYDSGIRKKVSEKQQAVMLCEARISGLQARERSARSEIDACMRAVGFAEESWRKSEIAVAQDAVRKAINEFITAVEGPIGIGIALSDNQLASFAKAAELPVCFDENGRNRNPLRSLRRWNENEAMRRGVLIHSAVHQSAVSAIAAARQALLGSGQRSGDSVVS